MTYWKQFTIKTEGFFFDEKEERAKSIKVK